MCREIQLGVASATQALAHAGIDLKAIDHERLGVEFGANLMLSAPDMLSTACRGVRGARRAQVRIHGLGVARLSENGAVVAACVILPNMPACHISIGSDARGPSNSLTLDDASGNTVLSEACRIIDRGRRRRDDHRRHRDDAAPHQDDAPGVVPRLGRDAAGAGAALPAVRSAPRRPRGGGRDVHADSGKPQTRRRPRGETLGPHSGDRDGDGDRPSPAGPIIAGRSPGR